MEPEPANPVSQIVVEVDWERVNQVLGALLAAYRRKSYPYNCARVPQDPSHLPLTMPSGGVEEATFWWTSCYYMRGGMKSNDAIVMLGVLYDAHPELFDPAVAAGLDPIILAETLRRYRLGYRYTQIAGFWIENARRMMERWEGDPRKILSGVTDYEECLIRIQNDGKGGGFLGFQEKMVSMVMYYFMHQGLTPFFVFPLPVDLHVLRVSIANRLIRFPDLESGGNMYVPETLRTMRDLYVRYSVENDVSPLEVCSAVWLLSMQLCGMTPGNVTLEPEGRRNRHGGSTKLVPQPLDVDDDRQREAYHRSCGSCPVSDTCESLIPSKPYYVAGVLVERGPRVAFPPPSQVEIIDATAYAVARAVTRKEPLAPMGEMAEQPMALSWAGS